MTKISLTDLVASIDRAKAQRDAADAGLADEGRIRQQIEAEEDVDGVLPLLALGHLDRQISGFPRMVAFESPNGYNKGVGAWRDDDSIWRAHFTGTALTGFRGRAGLVSRGSVVGHVLQAMHIPHSSEAYSRIREMASLGTCAAEIIENIEKLARRISSPALSSLYVHADDLFRDHKVLPDCQDYVDLFSMLRRHIAIDDTHRTNRIPVLVRCAQNQSSTSLSMAMLINLGAQVNAVDAFGNTALMGAANNVNSEKVSWLLRYGADASLKNTSQETALHALGMAPYFHGATLRSGVIEIMRDLVKAGCDPHAQDCRSRTLMTILDENLEQDSDDRAVCKILLDYPNLTRRPGHRS
jgi:hypothetical protein